MQQNLGWATGCNLVAGGLPAAVLPPIGFVLSDGRQRSADFASTVVVAANAELMRMLLASVAVRWGSATSQWVPDGASSDGRLQDETAQRIQALLVPPSPLRRNAVVCKEAACLRVGCVLPKVAGPGPARGARWPAISRADPA